MTELRASAAAFDNASTVLAGGVSSGVRRLARPHPLFFEAGQGSRLLDVDGNWYLDYVLGWGQAILGHAHPAQMAAVNQQLSRGTAHGAGSNLEVAVAERVLSRVPGIERLLWCTTGSEAAQLALRLARAKTGRNRFVKFAGHYHGWSDAMLLGYRFGPDGTVNDVESRGQSPHLRDDVDVLLFGDLDSVRRVVRDSGQDIAAVFVDPLMCNSGLVRPPDGFLQGLKELCLETGTVLVFDEVITGFRVARGGAIELFGVVPDLVVLAKAISGGFPLSAVGGRADILDLVVDGVFYSGTYNGNLVCLAAAGACLDALATPGVYQGFEARGKRLADGLAGAFVEFAVPATVRQIGPILHCSLNPQHVGAPAATSASDPTAYAEIAERLLGYGVFASPDGRWYVSAAHSDRDIENTITALTRVLEDMAHGPSAGGVQS